MEQQKWQHVWGRAEGLPSAAGVMRPDPIAPPAITEGYHSLYVRRPPLIANNSARPYDREALLLELHALLEPGQALGPDPAPGEPPPPLVFKAPVPLLLRLWMRDPATGRPGPRRRVVLLVSEPRLIAACLGHDPDSTASASPPASGPRLTPAGLRARLAAAVGAWALPFPVHLYAVQDHPPGPDAAPPTPPAPPACATTWLAVAYLQYRHRLRLEGAVLVAASAFSARGRKLAAALGARYIDGDVLLTQLWGAEGDAALDPPSGPDAATDGAPAPEPLHAILQRTAEAYEGQGPAYLRAVEFAAAPHPQRPDPDAADPLLERLAGLPTPDPGSPVLILDPPAPAPGPAAGPIVVHGAVASPRATDAFLTLVDPDRPRRLPPAQRPEFAADAPAPDRRGDAGRPADTSADRPEPGPAVSSGPDGDPGHAEDVPAARAHDLDPRPPNGPDPHTDPSPDPPALPDGQPLEQFFGTDLWLRGRKYFKHHMVQQDTVHWALGTVGSDAFSDAPPGPGPSPSPDPGDAPGLPPHPVSRRWTLRAEVRATDRVRLYDVALQVSPPGLPGPLVRVRCGCGGAADPAGPECCRHAVAVLCQALALRDAGQEIPVRDPGAARDGGADGVLSAGLRPAPALPAAPDVRGHDTPSHFDPVPDPNPNAHAVSDPDTRDCADGRGAGHEFAVDDPTEEPQGTLADLLEAHGAPDTTDTRALVPPEPELGLDEGAASGAVDVDRDDACGSAPPRRHSVPKHLLRASGPKKSPKAPVALHAPRRPRNAYQRFTAECRTALLVGGGIGERARAVAAEWKALSPDERQPYLDAAAEAKAQYDQDVAEYRTRYPEEHAAQQQQKQQRRRAAVRTAGAPDGGRAAPGRDAGPGGADGAPEEAADEGSWRWDEERGRYEHLSSDEDCEEGPRCAGGAAAGVGHGAPAAAPPPQPPADWGPDPFGSFGTTFDSVAEAALPDGASQLSCASPAPTRPPVAVAAPAARCRSPARDMRDPLAPPIAPAPAAALAKRVQFCSREQLLETPHGTSHSASHPSVAGPRPGTARERPGSEVGPGVAESEGPESQGMEDVFDLFFGPPAKRRKT